MGRLGVNIDHVATLRQAREENYPSVVEAARISLESGADLITIHLREDRRHIQDTDVSAVKLVTQRYGKPLNLEMGCNKEIIEIAEATRPDWICLVPEKREEKTTEGGLNLRDNEMRQKVLETCQRLKKNLPNTKISLFVECKKDILDFCLEMPIDAVEIHTGDYARAFLEGNPTEHYLKDYEEGREQIKSKNLGYHAGHGLTRESLAPLSAKNIFEEYNIGHWIICQAVFEGLSHVIKSLRSQV
jgi:pyridoxine 5-phosphate synthase